MTSLPLPDEAVEKLVDLVLGANQQATGTMSRTAARMQVENILGRVDRSWLLARALEREEINNLQNAVSFAGYDYFENPAVPNELLALLRAALAVKGNDESD